MSGMGIHLSENFALQSTFQIGKATRALQQRQRRTLHLYVGLVVVGLILAILPIWPSLRAGGLGLAFPGAGFLYWAAPDSPTFAMAWLLAGGCVVLFLGAVFLWFANGNVFAPALAWLIGVVAAGSGGFGGLAPVSWSAAPVIVLFLTMLPLSLVMRSSTSAGPVVPLLPRVWLREGQPNAHRDEDWQRLRLLLDRALQPIEEFQGFEFKDQFQTAAIRYQLNFISYAFSIVQACHMPAFTGYMHEAQRRLLFKQSDHRVWRYWQLENAWGYGRLDADPVPRGNIMYTGFVAAQIGYAEAASQEDIVGDGTALDLRHPDSRRYRYTMRELIECLAGQYREAPLGLLACEPNWIYPLCNVIAATAVQAYDCRYDTDFWGPIAARFREGLDRNFTRSDGRLVPFRSSLLGFAPPAIGGAVMDAFPSFFLNPLFPDLAERHWSAFLARVEGRDLARCFWPIDTGNYGLSRAAGLAAAAAAATEMGDAQMAQRLLDLLGDMCPDLLLAGVRHRPRASLWAHALETIARHGREGALRSLVMNAAPPGSSPYIRSTPYPLLLVAEARSEGEGLIARFYPGEESGPGSVAVEIGGLVPERSYRCARQPGLAWQADKAGGLTIAVPLGAPTHFHLVPLA